ncbi:hypothetical protein GOP47_0020957 [Adiantum capillus-veneris]|uniref:Polygalacturonase n=1 Tax=Adiantum capillus-veneris TaxID=13818 RepID=A0A9D4UAY5_ADICA|nr:hypothetical protein GOP47_0020957 [Adiantum capillus-veneris]
MEPNLPLVDVTLRTLAELHYSQWLLLIAISATSLVLLGKSLSCRRVAPAEWPPGPPALPIIGHLHLLGPLPHQSLGKLAQTYGPLMGLRLGGVPVIVASSSQMAKEILQTHDAALAYRPRTAAAVHVCFDNTDVAYALLGPYWKFLGQVYATELFNPKKMESFRHVREGEARGLVRAILCCSRERSGRVEVQGSLVTASNNINCRMAMGKKLEDSWNVLIQYVTILAPIESSNTDGIDPDSSSHVCIEDCYIENGDDLVSIKSGWDEHGINYGRPSSKIIIQRLVGGRGGYVKDVYISNVVLRNVKTAIGFTGLYGEHPDDMYDPNAIPHVHNVYIENVVGDNITMAGNFQGLSAYPYKDIYLINITLNVTSTRNIWNCSFVEGYSDSVFPAPCGDLLQKESIKKAWYLYFLLWLMVLQK